VTLGNPRLWLLALGLFRIDLVRFGFLDWAPTHLREAHGTGGTDAALKVAVFPLAGAAGALVSGWLTDRFFQSRRAPVIAIMLGLVGALTLVYDSVVPLGSLATIACLGLLGFFLFGAQILLVGTAAQDFAKLGTAAAAAGFVDFAGSMGAFAGDVVTGTMVKAKNWHGAIHVWGGAAIAGALLVAILWRARPHHAP
jgi:OPA family glycerol-3-phosphate transporter-like MFS transporter